MAVGARLVRMCSPFMALKGASPHFPTPHFPHFLLIFVRSSLHINNTFEKRGVKSCVKRSLAGNFVREELSRGFGLGFSWLPKGLLHISQHFGCKSPFCNWNRPSLKTSCRGLGVLLGLIYVCSLVHYALGHAILPYAR